MHKSLHVIHYTHLINNNASVVLFLINVRAANWNLAEPTWTGRMRLVAKGNNVNLKLEDKLSGALFANCPVETYPGIAIESVSDSSRYFVIRVLDDNGKLIMTFYDVITMIIIIDYFVQLTTMQYYINV